MGGVGFGRGGGEEEEEEKEWEEGQRREATCGGAAYEVRELRRRVRGERWGLRR